MINLIRHTNIYSKQYHNCTHVLAVLAERTTVLSAVTCRVARSLVFCVLFVLPLLTVSDYLFDIFKLFLIRIQVMSRLNDIYNWIVTMVIQYDRIYAITYNACSCDIVYCKCLYALLGLSYSIYNSLVEITCKSLFFIMTNVGCTRCNRRMTWGK
jgi:hypothetical protein